MIHFYKLQADRCDLEVRHFERECDVYETKAADEMMTGTSDKAQEYMNLADACRAEATLARKEASNYRNAFENWSN
tara:strand:+ start:1331 stop:1558 length:228 start_codon:yes stop_codon:yes gene_type:complete